MFVVFSSDIRISGYVSASIVQSVNVNLLMYGKHQVLSLSFNCYEAIIIIESLLLRWCHLAVILQILYASSIAHMDTNICRACDAGINTIVFDERSCKQHMEHSQMQEPHMQKQMQASCIPLVP